MESKHEFHRFAEESQLMYRYLTAFLAFQTLCVISGCGGGPELIQAVGKITVDGQPARGAVLLFHPTAEGQTTVSSATAKDDGTFTITTNTLPGIPTGAYIVTVSWPDPEHQPSDTEKMMGTAEPGKDLLKGRYILREKSQLSVTVEGSMAEMPPFELTTK